MENYDFMLECKQQLKAVVDELTDASHTWEEMDEYFCNSSFDVEYRIDSGKQYRSVKVMVCCGGPNIFIDTGSRTIKLYWGTTEEKMVIPESVADQIDAYWSEVYEDM